MAKSVSFEKSIMDLETIVTQLEKGDLTLDDALKQFEKGIKLARTCQLTLTNAEQKIEQLTNMPLNEGDFTDE
jgi:exodeoxyribonuclease VII small subunit